MKKIISAAEFDRRFDEGEDISDYVDWSTAKRPNLEKKRVYLSLPLWVINRLDRQAKSQGEPRSEVLTRIIIEHLES